MNNETPNIKYKPKHCRAWVSKVCDQVMCNSIPCCGFHMSPSMQRAIEKEKSYPKFRPVDDDYGYGDYMCYRREHPKLYGRWEIYLKEEFIGRAKDLKEAELKIINHTRTIYANGRRRK